MRLFIRFPILVLVCQVLTTGFSSAQGYELEKQGFSTRDFSQPFSDLDILDLSDFYLGDALFKRPWSVGSTGNPSSDGLGPRFNARSCEQCHIKDGKSSRHEIEGAIKATSTLVLKLQQQPHQFGQQLQPFAEQGLTPEPTADFSYQQRIVTYADGSTVELIKPTYAMPQLGAALNPRVAPAVFGLGLIDKLPNAAFLKNADPDDADMDGISGKVVWTYSLAKNEPTIGKFGWKASAANLSDQTAAAFSIDMGLSTSFLPDPSGDCLKTDHACQHHIKSPDEAEVSAKAFELILSYLDDLSPPIRQPIFNEGLKGKVLFQNVGCTACHSEQLAGLDPSYKPYSNFLVHDLGAGLADNGPDGLLLPSEWRTAPLWGLGSVQVVNPKAGFLHDGRARTIEEAILWHDGEAEASATKFKALTVTERNEMLNFLNGL